MILAGSSHLLPVPVETTAFLGACAGFVTLLLLVVLYLSRKDYFIPSASTTVLSGVCLPLCEFSSSSIIKSLKSSGEPFTVPGPENSSDSEEDALRKPDRESRISPDTLTIQAEDDLQLEDMGTTSNNCMDDHHQDQYQMDLDSGYNNQLHCQCIVEVGAANNQLDLQESESQVDNHLSPTTNDIMTIGVPSDDIGTLEVAFLYDAPMKEMTVQVLQGKGYPGGINGSQVRLVLLPSKKQRRKTRLRQGTSPQYMESFLFPRVNPEDVNAMGVRLRVYLWGGRMRRERLLGEARVCFDQINLQVETTLWLSLQSSPSSSVHDWGTTSSLTRSDSTGSQQSVQSYISPTTSPCGSTMKGGNTAEILIGLTYNGTTGRISVEIIKGSHFRGGRGSDTKPPDTYVKLSLVDSNCHEMARSKTSLRRAQPNPLYKETFIFQVPLFQLGEVTLFVSAYVRRRTSMGKRSKEIIGWLCLGLNNSSVEEEQHWNEMRSSQIPTQIQRWHSLHRP